MLIESNDSSIYLYLSLGVPSVAFDYSFNDQNVTTYPVYHSIHDTFNWVEKFVDPRFLIHLSVCKLTARLLLRMTDSDLLPIDVTSYSDALNNSMKTLRENVGYKLERASISIDHIEQAIAEFNENAHHFEIQKTIREYPDLLKQRIVNNQMANLEKIFINPYGLPRRPDTRNIVFAPSVANSYGSSSFPGISDTVSQEKVDWLEVKKQINILYKSIKEATESLKSVFSNE